jgi:hypothetical protein
MRSSLGRAYLGPGADNRAKSGRQGQGLGLGQGQGQGQAKKTTASCLLVVVVTMRKDSGTGSRVPPSEPSSHDFFFGAGLHHRRCCIMLVYFGRVQRSAHYRRYPNALQEGPTGALSFLLRCPTKARICQADGIWRRHGLLANRSCLLDGHCRRLLSSFTRTPTPPPFPLSLSPVRVIPLGTQGRGQVGTHAPPASTPQCVVAA